MPPLKPCPYRAEHEFDADGLCIHCYAQIPEERAQAADTVSTQPMEMPPDRPYYMGAWGLRSPKDGL